MAAGRFPLTDRLVTSFLDGVGFCGAMLDLDPLSTALTLFATEHLEIVCFFSTFNWRRINLKA